MLAKKDKNKIFISIAKLNIILEGDNDKNQDFYKYCQTEYNS